jgi:uncharacterized damage-inducible protein DinB
MIQRPMPAEHAPYYGSYIALVTEDDILSVLRAQCDETLKFLRAISESESTILHPPYTWTIKQVIGHIIDGERIFAYRALRIARGDTTPLPGFDENQYAKATEFSDMKLGALVNEFETVRRATISLFENLNPESWTRLGQANKYPVSVRAIAYIIAGHVRHHMNIVRKRVSLQPV